MNENTIDLNDGFTCPLPLTEYKNVLLAHGGGGKLSHQMIKKIFLKVLMILGCQLKNF